MVVRIRLHRKRFPRPNHLALAAGSLLLPLALTAFTIALWAFASELLWSGDFFISNGLFAHWQAWLALATVLLLLGRVLVTLGEREAHPDSEASRLSGAESDTLPISVFHFPENRRPFA